MVAQYRIVTAICHLYFDERHMITFYLSVISKTLSADSEWEKNFYCGHRCP